MLFDLHLQMLPCLESKLCQSCRTNDGVTHNLLLHCPGDKFIQFFVQLSIALCAEMGTFCDMVSLLPGGSYCFSASIDICI